MPGERVRPEAALPRNAAWLASSLTPPSFLRIPVEPDCLAQDSNQQTSFGHLIEMSPEFGWKCERSGPFLGQADGLFGESSSARSNPVNPAKCDSAPATTIAYLSSEAYMTTRRLSGDVRIHGESWMATGPTLRVEC